MGWLQGLRYQNDRQLQEAAAHAQKRSVVDTESAHCEHIERSESQGSLYSITEGESKNREADHGLQKLLGTDPLLQCRQRPLCDESMADTKLPFIPKEEVTSKRTQSRIQADGQSSLDNLDLWIVINNIVYDCSGFVADHPGGQQVIRSFVGEDCSWQFWRFHGKKEMDTYGRGLRVGQTAGVTNRFKEPSRYVGLSRIGHDEW